MWVSPPPKDCAVSIARALPKGPFPRKVDFEWVSGSPAMGDPSLRTSRASRDLPSTSSLRQAQGKQGKGPAGKDER